MEYPILFSDNVKLTKLAVAKVDVEGYIYNKKESRSKQLNLDSDNDSNQTKHSRMEGDVRAKRVTEVTEDLKEVKKRIELIKKQRDRYSNSQEYFLALSLSEKMENDCQKKRKLEAELKMLEEKEKKSVKTKRYNMKKKIVVDYSTSHKSEISLASSAAPSQGSSVKNTKRKISQFFAKGQDDNITEAGVPAVKDDAARPARQEKKPKKGHC